jgi:hypothetical protein
MDCVGTGVTDSTPGFSEEEVTALPRPPAVMRSPCLDCAFRPGSPEEENGSDLANQDLPFYCHHGMTRVDPDGSGAGYLPAAWFGLIPLGYMVCAGWWEWRTNGVLPERPFRDPGGANRPTSAPASP